VLCLAEVGDYVDELADQGYLSTLKLLPNQTPELEYKIMEHHREHMYVCMCDIIYCMIQYSRYIYHVIQLTFNQMD